MVNKTSTLLGPLEWRVLDALWARGAAATVRELQPEFSDIAYTTLMTTLDLSLIHISEPTRPY